MFPILITWLTVALFILMYILILFSRRLQRLCQDQNSASQPNSTLSPEIFYIHVLESGPYQSSDPLSSSKIDMKNLAPPPYQLEETSPCESSVEKPPNYQISIE
ncbi:uncharacterized protein isoform X1 [Leptinotarsa decemlineata]|uniref:uncharacterized protein isoform X1 n=1 Tax=Leptinotarsa decemlineata TaxID=7539 RepID=UPI003D30B81C